MSVLHIKTLPHFDGLPLPEYKTDDAAGFDLCAAVEGTLTLAPGKYKLVKTGLSVAIPKGHEMQIRPRSGLAFKNGITILNSPGTIDADYRGEIGILLMNCGQESFEITRGMRIAQAVIAKYEHVQMELVTDLDATDRGQGGFGSTGTNG